MGLVEDILEAERRIRPHIRETPIQPFGALRGRGGGELICKLENLQHTGSFKLRGALNKVLRLAPSVTSQIITASSGNHGLGVAYAARLIGQSAQIFVPETASPIKVSAIRTIGSTVEFHGHDSVQTEIYARKRAEQTGGVYISPYNDLDVIAGQGTLAVELLRQANDIRTIFVAVGGGGLISGIAAYVKHFAPGANIVGCSPAMSPVMARSVEAGRILDLPSNPTLSDATAGGLEPNAITFSYCQNYVDYWIDVTEAQIAEAIRLFFDHNHMIVEGAAAVALAAALVADQSITTARSAIIVCGANISRDVYRAVL